MLNRFLILLLLALTSNLWGQQFHFKQYSLEQGLPRVGVYDIHQDQNGFLWIATEGGGICKFDGKEFHSYTRRNGLPSDNIRLIFAASDNTIWLATDNGICYFDGAKFITVDLGERYEDVMIRSICEDKSGRIWLGSELGLTFVNGQAKIVDDSFKINQSFIDSNTRTMLVQNDKIWIGTDSGLYYFQNDKIYLFEMQSELTDYRILKLFKDSKNNLWVGTQTGLNKIENNQVSKWGVQDGLVSGRARSIVEDRYGNIWIGTSRGISIFDGYEFISITAANGLSNERIRCLYVDSFDNVWVGSFFGGIMRYNYKDFTGFTMHEGLASNQVQSISEDEYGDILVGTNGGFSQLEIVNNKLYNYSTIKLSAGYTGNSIKAILYDQNGYTWLGTNQGLSILQGDFRKDISFQSDDEEAVVSVTAIKFFNNKYWVGTNHGLYHVDVSTGYENFQVTQLSNEDSLAGNEVSIITQDLENRIWIGFSDGGISLYDHGKFVNPTLSENLENIVSLAIDSTNRLWIGTNGNGLFYGDFDVQKKQLNLHNLSVNENLSSNYIYSILISDEDIWIGHEKGIDILVGATDSVHTILHCGTETGFKGLQNSAGASYRDSQGNLWFGTINGLYRLNGRELDAYVEGKSSIIYLEGLKVNGEIVDWNKSEWCDSTTGIFNLPTNLVLPYNKNNIDFEFIGLNFIAPEKIKYSWMLEGFDEGWHSPSSDNHASYTNLEYGSYVFRLRASNDLGVIQEVEMKFSFEIAKPFWHTWLFRIFAAIVVFVLGFLIMRWRTKQLRNNQKKLEAIIEQRTTEIKGQNEVLEEKNKEITDSIFYSRRIQRSMLPAKEKVKKLFDNYFIFFRPKDIVSGDFYWAEKSLDKTKTFFAVADCTGHGVPGAMVSLIGTRALNSAVRESGATKTNEILDLINEMMIESFTDSESNGIIKDGMDISLCALDYTNDKFVAFQYAGAQNSVWIVRAENEENISVNGKMIEPNLIAYGHKLFEIKADKQPIGYFDGRVPFKNKECNLKIGDRIYLYSDGFADQFGGEKGKKFKYKTLKELILSVQNKSVNDQYNDIRTAFYDWKREFEQIDDVCFMGVEV